MLTLANLSNGLVRGYDDICYFQSNFGHSAKYGYFRIDSMPYRAIVYLLKGGIIKITDATARNKSLTDGLKYGVPTWCIVFNRALDFKGSRHIKVCDWQTREMKGIALSNQHKKTVQTIRKLVKIYGYTKPAVVGNNVLLECEKLVNFDDKPKAIRNELILRETKYLVGKGHAG